MILMDAKEWKPDSKPTEKAGEKEMSDEEVTKLRDKFSDLLADAIGAALKKSDIPVDDLHKKRFLLDALVNAGAKMAFHVGLPCPIFTGAACAAWLDAKTDAELKLVEGLFKSIGKNTTPEPPKAKA